MYRLWKLRRSLLRKSYSAQKKENSEVPVETLDNLYVKISEKVKNKNK